MSNTTPAIPFLLTRWTRFVPTFQTDNTDASLGADGFGAGSHHIVGRTLVMMVDWFLDGAGASPGTGNLLIPFPPGYTSADVDVAAMPRVEDEEDTVEGMVAVLCVATIDAGRSVRACNATIATTAGVVVAAILELDGFATISDGDSLQLRIELPIKEPALPG